MKIKVLTIIGVFAMMFLAVGCSPYKRAIIKGPDGEVKAVEISSYGTDRFSGRITIKDKEGNIYFTDMKNVLLVNY